MAIVAVVTVIILYRELATGFEYSSIANFLAAIAALGAVIVAIRSEIRTQQRFDQANANQQRTNAASIKPYLMIHRKLDGPVEVRLYNDGLGPAIIKKPTYTKNGRSGESIPAVLDLGFKYRFGVFVGESMALRPRDHLVLVSVTAEDLKKQNFDDKQIKECFRKANEELKGLKVSVPLEDMFQNKQPTFEVNLG